MQPLEILGVVASIATIIAALPVYLGSSHHRCRAARARALRATESREVRAAARSMGRELRPSHRDGERLLNQLLKAGPPEMRGEAEHFLADLREEFEVEGLVVRWQAPAGTSSVRPPASVVSPPTSAIFGRVTEMDELRQLIGDGRSVGISGAPGIGKSTLLRALAAEIRGAIFVRLEQGGAPMRDLRLALHGVCGGEFPVDDDQGLATLARELPQTTVLFVDNADEDASAAAVRRLASHLPTLTIAVTTRGQTFSEFKEIRLEPISQASATELAAHLGVVVDRVQDVVDAGAGNPQMTIQQARALEEHGSVKASPLAGTLAGVSKAGESGLLLIGDLPSATLPIQLLADVGRMTQPDLLRLERHAVLRREGPDATLHQTLRDACAERVIYCPTDVLEELRHNSALYYADWLDTGPETSLIDSDWPNLVHLLRTLRADKARVRLACAAIGDRLDDPRGYIPSRGLSGLLLQDLDKLSDSANAVGGPMAAALEKNLGLFCYWANNSNARDLLLRAEERYREIGDGDGRAAATWILGYLADDSCDYNEAQALYAAPLAWVDNDSAKAVSHHLLGCSLYHQGRFDDARSEFDLARSLTSQAGLIARINRRLAYIELADGDVARAIDQLTIARDEARSLGRPRDVARLGRHLGDGYLRLGELARATEELSEALEAFENLQDKSGIGSSQRGLAECRRREQRFREAADLAECSLAIAESGTLRERPLSPIGIARAEQELGEIRALEAGPGSAAPHFRRAANVLEVLSHADATEIAQRLGPDLSATFPSSVTAVVFDLVDTLATIAPGTYDTWKEEIARRLGVERRRFQASWSNSRARASTDAFWTVEDRLRFVAEDLGVTVPPHEIEAISEAERNLWSSTKLKPGAADMLAALGAAGYSTAIVSNGSETMRGLARHLGIENRVDAYLLSVDVGLLKPDARIYRRACTDIGASPSTAVYVGDGNDRELEGAMAAGMFAVRLKTGERPAYGSTMSLNWDATVGSFEELANKFGLGGDGHT